jgi:hypothetical protein
LGVFDAFCFIKSEYWCSILDFALLFSKKVWMDLLFPLDVEGLEFRPQGLNSKNLTQR